VTNNDKKIAEVALQLLKNKNWKNLTLNEIKNKSKITQFNKLIKNKNMIIKKINKYIDYKLALQSKYLEKSNNKDMIFEILMMRFDIIQKYRKSIISIFNSFKTNPQDLFFLLPNIIESIVLMVNYTNISSKGVLGQLKIKGVLIIYIYSFFVWIKDETSSLEKTMISLDKNLDHAGKILGFVK
jgi:hypothetical protein